MNCWNFTGNLGQDAESRFTSGGDAITSFSVAVKAGYGDKATTTWVRCSLFGKRGEAVAPYLKKGTQVGVSGEAALREWTDKEGGKRTSLEVRVNDVTLLGGKPERHEPKQEPKRGNDGGAGPGPEDLESDIPF